MAYYVQSISHFTCGSDLKSKDGTVQEVFRTIYCRINLR